jgi:hypothetical protein
MKWLILIENFGPIVINMSRVINDIFTMAFTYGILIVAFTFGLVFILDESSMKGNSTRDIGNNDSIRDYAHKFGTLMMGLGFIFLDPGNDYKPKIPDVTPRDKFATFMFVIYNVFAITILLNLTVTLMNSTIQRFEDRRQLHWKCKRTSVLIEYFDCKLYLPVPFSFFLVVWTVVFLPVMKGWIFFTCMDNEKDETEEDHLPLATLKARKKHAKLMQELIIRFINKSKMKQKMALKGKSVQSHESKC